MRPLRALGIYAVVVFPGAALLAPWIYLLAQKLSIRGIADESFARHLTSTLLFVAVVGLWPLFRSLGARSLREAGLPRFSEHRREFLNGLFIGLISLAVVAAITLALGGRSFHTAHSPGRIATKLVGAVFTAAGVAVLEELLFRGGIFGGLRRVFHWQVALVMSSMIYSAMHFLEGSPVSGDVNWASGLQLLPQIFGGDKSFAQQLPKFLNLTLAGTVLGLAFQRTGNLWFSIGLHAGWIFWLASYRVFTSSVPDSATWWWGGNKMIDGWLAFVVLAATLLLLSRSALFRERNSVVR